MKNKQSKNKKNTVIFWIAGILVVLVIVFLATQKFGQTVNNSGLPGEVTVQKAVELRDKGAFILDVRELSEWQEKHIPGATLIPLGELQSRLHELPEDQDIVVVCRSGNRSQSGRDILLAAGFENVTSMSGGVNQWQLLGNPVESGN